MVLSTDSYLKIILPEDISFRIGQFINGRCMFPFVKNSELICIFYLYGKNKPLNITSRGELKEAFDLAERTVAKMSNDIKKYQNDRDKKLNSQFIREKYINRGLQIIVDKRADLTTDRIVTDPSILSDCFAQHIALYDQDFFFEVYGPFERQHLIKDIENILIGRIVMVGYNRKNDNALPFKHALIPLYTWMRDNNWGALKL
jgi:hypothetical protein